MIAAQNKAIRTNHINKTANIGYAVTDETTNHIISECNKLAQKEYKCRHDWVEQGDPLGNVQEI